MKKFFIFLTLLLPISNNVYSHDESTLLSTDCSHKFMTAGATYSQIYFAFSFKNLKSHEAVNLSAEDGQLNVNVELTNSSGEIEKHADHIYYQIKDNEPFIMQNWITIEKVSTESELNELKERIGNSPKTNCNVIL